MYRHFFYGCSCHLCNFVVFLKSYRPKTGYMIHRECRVFFCCPFFLQMDFAELATIMRQRKCPRQLRHADCVCYASGPSLLICHRLRHSISSGTYGCDDQVRIALRLMRAFAQAVMWRFGIDVPPWILIQGGHVREILLVSQLFKLVQWVVLEGVARICGFFLIDSTPYASFSISLEEKENNEDIVVFPSCELNAALLEHMTHVVSSVGGALPRDCLLYTSDAADE